MLHINRLLGKNGYPVAKLSASKNVVVDSMVIFLSIDFPTYKADLLVENGDD